MTENRSYGLDMVKNIIYGHIRHIVIMTLKFGRFFERQKMTGNRRL